MSATPVQRLESARRRSGVALMLAVALALVQTLGLLHRIAHAGPVHGTGATFVVAQSAAVTGEPALLEALFAGHEDDRDCTVFDHISHAELAVSTETAATAGASLPVLPQAHAAWHVAAQAQAFLARGPPPLS